MSLFVDCSNKWKRMLSFQTTFCFASQSNIRIWTHYQKCHTCRHQTKQPQRDMVINYLMLIFPNQTARKEYPLRILSTVHIRTQLTSLCLRCRIITMMLQVLQRQLTQNQVSCFLLIKTTRQIWRQRPTHISCCLLIRTNGNYDSDSLKTKSLAPF